MTSTFSVEAYVRNLFINSPSTMSYILDSRETHNRSIDVTDCDVQPASAAYMSLRAMTHIYFTTLIDNHKY